MIKTIRTDSKNSDFERLVQFLDADLAKRDGAAHLLSQFNTIATLKYVVLAFNESTAIGCGAISLYDSTAMEIKRMYVSPEFRGKRIGEKMLRELEDWSRELGYSKCLLFMGSKQPEANALYLRNGYYQIDKYGHLKDIPDSLCFEKYLLEQ